MANAALRHRNPVFAADVRRLGGVVNVHTARDRNDGAPIFRVGYVSGGGDVAFLSLPMMLEDHAAAAARVLAEFTSAAVVARETSASDLTGAP